MAFSSYAIDYLALVNNSTKRDELYLIGCVGKRYLCILNEEKRECLESNSIPFQIIDSNPRKKIYYKVYPIHNTERDFLNTMGDILIETKDCVFLRISSENKERLEYIQGDLVHIGFQRMKFESVILPHMKNMKIVHNPLI